MSDTEKLSARDISLHNGAPTYRGKLCQECGNHERRTVDYLCVRCLDLDDGKTPTQIARSTETHKAMDRERKAQQRQSAADDTTPYELLVRSIVDGSQTGDTTTRKHALAHGLSRYQPRKPCPTCDTHERYTANGACVACQADSNREACQMDSARMGAAQRQAAYRARMKAKRLAARIEEM